MDEQRSTLYKNNNFNELCLKVQNHVLKHPLFLSAKNICTYAPAKSEIDVNSISQTAWEQNKAVYYPRCSKTQKGIMHFYLCNNFSELEKGAYGILEPKKSCPICSEDTLSKRLPFGIRTRILRQVFSKNSASRQFRHYFYGSSLK